MKIILIGAGGHARVVYDSLRLAGITAADIEVRVGMLKPHEPLFMGREMMAPELPSDIAGKGVHVAIGSSSARSRFLTEAMSGGGEAFTVIHPHATISANASVGGGSFVAAGAIVSVAAILGEGVIVNHNAVVDHDCNVGSWSHIAPSAVLGGGVTIGQNTLVGARAVVLPGLSVGDNVIIGAGSIVTKSIAAGCKWIGTAVVHQDAKK